MRSTTKRPTICNRDAYRGLLPEDLIDILTVNRLHYDQRTESGVLFHLIGAVSEFGKLGLTAIANSPAEAQELYDRTLSMLAVETRYGHEPRPHHKTHGSLT